MTSPNDAFDVTVIGSGPGGYVAAIAAGTLCRERFINYLKLDFELEKLSQRQKKRQLTVSRRTRRELHSKAEKYSNKHKRR